MSFQLRILGGFGLLLLLCIVQVGYLLWTTSRVGAGWRLFSTGPCPGRCGTRGKARVRRSAETHIDSAGDDCARR